MTYCVEMTEDEHRELDNEVAGCAAAHQRLHQTLNDAAEGNLDALDPTKASALPDWTIGHVLTHIARNADAFRFMIEGANAGEQRLMYPSAEARNVGIDAGANRTLDALIDDVRASSWALEASWAALTAVGWDGAGLTRNGPTPIRSMPWRRWREVEVHHADLGLSTFGPSDWSSAFVASDLARELREWEADGGVLPQEVATAAPWQRLAWLYGRNSGLLSPSQTWG